MNNQGLYPIVRRVRRPLLVHDRPAAVVGSVEPVTVEGGSSASSTGNLADVTVEPEPVELQPEPVNKPRKRREKPVAQ